MSHTTKIVEHTQLSNGQYSVKIRCCDDPSTDHVHTVSVTQTLAQQTASIDKAEASVASLHEKSLTSHEHVKKTILGRTRTHD